MALATTLIVNGDDALLFWRPDAPIADCRGFAIERERRHADGRVVADVLENRMGFAADKPQRGEHRPSTEWPFQRLWWTDHGVDTGDTVRYRVTPMARKDGALRPLTAGRSAWTPWRTLGPGTRDGYSLYFNRALVISQFMARYLERLRVEKHLATRQDALKAFKDSLDEHELPIRRFLGGALRDGMLALLADARDHRKSVHAALYELSDDELVAALCALGDRAHVVLANGSIEKRKDETTAEARQRDENASARARLRAAGVDVHDRFTSPGALAHNKFLVVCNPAGQPEAAWTGSTNWTPTGLCTQTNNGLRVTHRAFAREYLTQYERLRDAGSAFPTPLVAANSQAKPVKTGRSTADVWFTRTKGQVDLAALDEAIRAAKDGVLFLMFQPGAKGALKTIRDLAKADPALYVRGVVSTLPDGADTGSSSTPAAVAVDLHAGPTRRGMSLDIVQPRGVDAFANWAATVSRREFLTSQGGVVGHAIVHSKVIVIDPFTHPVVITGSHNFSGSASTSNDENFVIVRGNAELAASYAAHVMGVYDHYRWLTVLGERQDASAKARAAAKAAKAANAANAVKGTAKVATGAHGLTGYLEDSDAWLARRLASSAQEMAFWARR